MVMDFTDSDDAPRELLPCPVCGYDLRGHGGRPRCPECGQRVNATEAAIAQSRWVDMRLLDLWSISVLQLIGSICAITSVVAIRQGQYVAVGLAMAAGIYVLTATLWYAILLPLALLRLKTPAFRGVPSHRRIRLWAWMGLDGGLVVVLWPILAWLA